MITTFKSARLGWLGRLSTDARTNTNKHTHVYVHCTWTFECVAIATTTRCVLLCESMNLNLCFSLVLYSVDCFFCSYFFTLIRFLIKYLFFTCLFCLHSFFITHPVNECTHRASLRYNILSRFFSNIVFYCLFCFFAFFPHFFFFFSQVFNFRRNRCTGNLQFSVVVVVAVVYV